MTFLDKITLTKPEREIYRRKILPLALVGCTILFVGELVFLFLLTSPPFSEFFVTTLIITIIAGFVLFFLSFLTARAGNNAVSIFFLLIFSFISGSYSVPIFLWSYKLNVFIYGILSLGVAGTVLIYLISLIMNEHFLEKGFLKYNILLVLLLIALFEIIFILLLDITSLFTIILSIISMFYVCFIQLFYGPNIAKKVDKENWVFWGIRILSVLLITVIVVVIILILIVISEGDFDISGGGGSVGGSSKTKVQKKELVEP